METHTNIQRILLDITGSDSVVIKQGSRVLVGFEDEADNSGLSVSKKDTDLQIKLTSQNKFNNSFSSYQSVVSNGTVMIGDVYMNEINMDGDNVNITSIHKPRKLIITCPDNLDLKVNLIGSSKVKSEVNFSNADLNMTGSSKLKVNAETITLNLTGSGSAKLTGTNLYLNTSGSGSVECKHKGGRLAMSSSGTSKIKLLN